MNLLQSIKRSIKIKRGGVDLTFLVLVLILLAFGLVMMFSASYAMAFYRFDGDSYHFISRQVIFAVVGLVAMWVASMVDYHIFHRLAWPIMGVCLVLLVLVLFMGGFNNAARWIIIGGFTLQPSEVAKFALVVLFAHMMSINFNKMKDWRYGLAPYLGVMGVLAVLLILEPHLSCTVLICLIGATMMFVGGTDLKWFAVGIGVVAVLLVVVANSETLISYGGERIEAWLDPFADNNTGYQTRQSLYAIASGGLLGTGVGNSRQKYLFLPEPHNDFIFSVCCEELGFVGAVIIILLFALLIWRGFVIAARARDRFGTLMAVGLVAQVGYQAVLNIAVVTNTIPNTGISLPFFSYGGTALMMLLGQMGVLLSISRQAVVEKE